MMMKVFPSNHWVRPDDGIRENHSRSTSFSDDVPRGSWATRSFRRHGQLSVPRPTALCLAKKKRGKPSVRRNSISFGRSSAGRP